MDNQWILFAAILILTAVLALVIAGVLVRHARVQTGRAEMAHSLIMLVVWAFCYAMVILSASPVAKSFWFRLEHVGIVGQPVFWFFFALNYTNLSKPLKWPWTLVLGIIPAISLVALFSPHWMSLYYPAVPMPVNGVGPFNPERGTLYWVQWMQNTLLYIVSAVLLLRWFFTNRTLYRWRTGLLIAAVLVPWVAILAYEAAAWFDPTFSFPINYSPITLTVSVALIGAILFGFRTFDLLPIARDVVVEHIPEMVVVTDAHDRVIDANAVALQWLNKSEKEIIGQDPLDVFHSWPPLVSRFLLSNETHEEIMVGDPPRTLELVVTPIYSSTNIVQGRVIVAHDVTERKHLENNLRTQLEENEALRAKLEEQATRDPLTGAFNRRFFAETLDKEVSRAAREGTPISIIILDLDFFKRFNDTYGHKCGDVVLQALATMLAQNTRGGDVVCRYGGEEFVILMPNSSVDVARERAEFLRARYEALETHYRGQDLHATFSAGVAGYPVHGADGDVILNCADQALYRSKAEGRNRVSIFDGEPNKPLSNRETS